MLSYCKYVHLRLVIAITVMKICPWAMKVSPQWGRWAFFFERKAPFATTSFNKGECMGLFSRVGRFSRDYSTCFWPVFISQLASLIPRLSLLTRECGYLATKMLCLCGTLGSESACSDDWSLTFLYQGARMHTEWATRVRACNSNRSP